MVDIALVNPRTEFIKDEKDVLSNKSKNATYKDNYLSFLDEFIREPPTGLMILASILEADGYTVDFIDCSIMEDPFNFLRENAKKYRLLGFTSLTNTFSITLQLAKTAKRFNPNSFIIMGGPHVSFEYENILQENSFIDAICIGESEESFPWLVNKILLESSVDIIYKNSSTQDKKYLNYPGKIQEILKSEKQIPNGISFLSKPFIDPFLYGLFTNDKYRDSLPEIEIKISSTPISSEIEYTGFPQPLNLSNIPFPARHLIPLTYSVADVIVNRGCPNKCSFCSRTKLFPTMRIRKIENIMKEIDQILDYSNYKFINFYDNININKRFFDEFLNKLIEKKIPLPWGSELRVDTITDEQASLMKESNCSIIATGVESADETVLKTNFKFQDPKKVANGIKILKKADIPIQAYFVIGLPGETESTFKKTLNYLKNLPLISGVDRVEFFVATPYPGSDLALNKEKYGIKLSNKHYNFYNCREIIMETSTLDRIQIKEMVSQANNLCQSLGYN
ncbi:MAG: B12-binding domain-containing radical SAM protein [archaeon]|nr:B12-binding domain-containing radical SAM protein [archaeon]